MRVLSRRWLSGLLLAIACTGAGFLTVAHGQESTSESPDLESLLKQLRSEKVEEQIDAVVQLGALGPYAQSAIEPLVRLLQTENGALRYECIMTLGRIGPMAHDSVKSLTGFLTDESDDLKSAALDSLRRIGSASPDAEAQIRRLCQHKDAALATSAVRCLVMIAGPDNELVRNSIPNLVKALGDERADVRNEATLALVEIGAAVEPVASASLSATNPKARLKACEILGQLGSAAEKTVPALLLRLKDDDELIVRAATTALGRIHAQPKLVLPALNALLGQKSTAVRITAVRAIAEFGTEAADSAPLIVKVLADENTVLRASAAETLGHIKDARVEVIDALVKALSDASGMVTVNAANALSQMGTPAVSPLVKMLDDENYRALAVEVLGEIGPDAESAVPALVNLLPKVGDDEDLQRGVFIALATIGPKATAATPAMMKILQDSSAGNSRAGAAYVLAHIGETKALPVLKEILKTSDNERALRASAWALVKLDPKNSENVGLVMPYLIKATSSDIPLARREAMTAFATLGPSASAALPALLEHAAKDPDATVRSESLHGLAEIQAPAAQVLPVAIASLNDPDPTVRNSARYLLGRLGDEAHSAAPLLRETLRRGDEFERVISAWALVHVESTPENSQAAIPLLLKALQHPNPHVRMEAAVTLGMIGSGSKEARASLESAKADPDPGVKEAVLDALNTIKKAQ